MSWRVKGFENQKRAFLNLIKQNSLSHAYIFEGPDQIGKKLFAEDLFAVLNSRSTFSDNDPDLYLMAPKTLEGETKMYVEDMRDLKSFLALRSFYGPNRCVIIDDAHRLTPEASNAFLKMLEEPSENIVFILVTSQPRELLPTIASRAQHISFLPHADAAVAEALQNSKLSKTDQELITKLARGRIGWAIQVAAENKVGEIKQAVQEFNDVLKSKTAERMLFAKKLFEKQPYQEHVSYWLNWIYANRSEMPNAHKILTSLLTLNQFINQPQYNHRALLENTLINL